MITNKVCGAITPSNSVSLESFSQFIESLIRTEEGFKEFVLTEAERSTLEQTLAQVLHEAKLYPQHLPQFELLALTGVKFIRLLPSYQRLLRLHYQQQVAEHLQKVQIPLSQHPQLTQNLEQLQLKPADCAALKEWPEGRKVVNTRSGRLENAGQFMERLLKQKLYDEDLYGKLYLNDLRTINPKLYLALGQWQNRTGVTLVEKKSAKLQELEHKAIVSPEQLSFPEKVSLSNARWRRKHA